MFMFIESHPRCILLDRYQMAVIVRILTQCIAITRPFTLTYRIFNLSLLNVYKHSLNYNIRQLELRYPFAKTSIQTM